MTLARKAELEARCTRFLEDNEPTPEQLMAFVMHVEREVREMDAQIVERHGSHPVKVGEPMSAWVATPFYEKSKEIAKEIRTQAKETI